jgi:hypothetical protein
VVEVGVAEDERVGGERPRGHLAIVAVGFRPVPLKQATVERDVDAADVKPVQRPRDLIGRAVELEVAHRGCTSSRRWQVAQVAMIFP